MAKLHGCVLIFSTKYQTNKKTVSVRVRCKIPIENSNLCHSNSVRDYVILFYLRLNSLNFPAHLPFIAITLFFSTLHLFHTRLSCSLTILLWITKWDEFFSISSVVWWEKRYIQRVCKNSQHSAWFRLQKAHTKYPGQTKKIG